MAVVGVGVDAVEIERMRVALERTPTLVDRLFTPGEQRQCTSRTGRRRYARFAVRFAAKEAVAKALNTGVVGFGFRDIEIVNADSGAPRAELHRGALDVAVRSGVTAMHLSLSVTRDVAVATAVAEG